MSLERLAARLAFLCAVTLASAAPALAKVDVRGWHADLLSQAEALVTAVRDRDDAKLGRQILIVRSVAQEAARWPMTAVDGLVARPCQGAALVLLQAAEAADARDRGDWGRSWDAFERLERECREALGRERRGR